MSPTPPALPAFELYQPPVAPTGSNEPTYPAQSEQLDAATIRHSWRPFQSNRYGTWPPVHTSQVLDEDFDEEVTLCMSTTSEAHERRAPVARPNLTFFTETSTTSGTAKPKTYFDSEQHPVSCSASPPSRPLPPLPPSQVPQPRPLPPPPPPCASPSLPINIRESTLSKDTSTASVKASAPKDTVSPPTVLSVPTTIHERRHLTGFSLRAEVTRVINGTYRGRAVTYIGLLVTYDTPSIVEWSKITAIIRPLQPGSPSQPSIIRYSPKQLYGTVKTVEETLSHEVEGSISSANVPATAGLTGKRVHGTSSSRDVRRWLVCGTRPLPHGHGRSVLELEARQNDVQGDGIFGEIAIGFIVEHHDEPFALTVEVEVKRSLLDSVFPISAKPYTDTRPALFDGKVNLLRDEDSGLSKEMELWDEVTWKRLVRYTSEYQDVSCFAGGRTLTLQIVYGE